MVTAPASRIYQGTNLSLKNLRIFLSWSYTGLVAAAAAAAAASSAELEGLRSSLLCLLQSHHPFPLLFPHLLQLALSSVAEQVKQQQQLDSDPGSTMGNTLGFGVLGFVLGFAVRGCLMQVRIHISVHKILPVTYSVLPSSPCPFRALLSCACLFGHCRLQRLVVSIPYVPI